jgi:hypothetical protein
MYTEIKDRNLTVDLNKQIEKIMDNQKDDADTFLFKGSKKQSTWVSSFLTKAGVKGGSKTNNTGSINLLRHSFIDYRIGIIDNMDYSSEERIKLATMMRHSVQTSPSYLFMVLAELLTPKEKKEVASIQNTRSKSN